MTPREAHALGARVVPSSYVRLLVRMLGEEGVTPSRVLRRTGLGTRDLVAPDQRITYEQQLRTYANAEALTRRPGLGLRMGARETAAHHGVFGYALQSSADLAQAIQVMLRYHETVGPLIAMPSFRVDGDEGVLTMTEAMPLGSVHVMAVEEMLATWTKFVAPLCGAGRRIAVDYPAPPHRALYRRMLGCPVAFSADAIEYRIPAACLGARLEFSDDETAVVCARQCEALMARIGSGGAVAERVRRALVEAGGPMPDLDLVARSLAVSPRTLRRRLLEEGTSFRAVVEGTRKGLALQYLEESNLSLDEIASLLGYTDTPNFHRAFRRWTGATPASFR